MSQYTYSEGWKRILERAEVPHVGTHGIRHRATTVIANSGVPAKVGMQPQQRKARRLLSGLLALRGVWFRVVNLWQGTKRAETGPVHSCRAVLNALRDELRDPKRITEFVRTYHEERRRLAAKDGATSLRSARRRCAASNSSTGTMASSGTSVVTRASRGLGRDIRKIH
jgi:hypothetical protein